jgi:pyrroline-5-carboxylate reductase
MKQRSIGLLGAGNMAGALIKSLLNAKATTPDRIMASDVREERLEELHRTFGVGVTEDNAKVVAFADLLVLCVKPQVIDKILPVLHDHLRPESLLVSIVAGVRLAALEARLAPGARLIRAMPNTPAMVLAGATAIAAGSNASAEDVLLAKQLFNTVGKTVVLEETLLDAVTGLSGSGPAYVMLMIEALADGGVKVGLHRETALLLAAQTVYGSAKLLIESGEHPGRLKDMVTSPGGTAIAGLHTLESGGLRRTLMDAVENATIRAGELGEQIDRKLAGNGKR